MKNSSVPSAIREALAALTEGETTPVLFRCPEARCRTRLTLDLAGITFLSEDSRFGNTDTSPKYPSTEGRNWIGTAAWLDDPQGFFGGQPTCDEHGRRLTAILPPKARTPRAPRPKVEKPVGPLPKIVTFLGISDAGEYGAATCPHCGADGRYVHEFITEDGATRGAMSGCIKLFPVSPVAAEHRALIERDRDREKNGRRISSWDEVKQGAIEAFYRGDLSEADALSVIQTENQRRSDWMNRKFASR